VRELLAKLAWVGPLLVRITLGVVFVSTGWGKLHHLADVGDYFASLGIPAPAAQALLVAVIEFAGGLLVLFGLCTRVASALLVGVMAVALATAIIPHLEAPLDLAGTKELAYLAMFAWLAVAGGGAASVDSVIATNLNLERQKP
jgi:putative oxidoreductase